MGTAGDATVRLRNVPAVRCAAATHPARYVAPDFGSALYRQLVSGSVPLTSERFWRRSICFACGAPVQDSGEPMHVHAVLTVLERQVELDLTAPHGNCSRCGQRQIFAGGARFSDILDACITAFRNAALHA